MQIITCCLLDGHWVTIRIKLLDWEIQLFDSFLFRMRDDFDRPLYFMRDHQLWPVYHMLPGLLAFARYWQKQDRDPPSSFTPLCFKKMGSHHQFEQFDKYSGGAFSAMYVDRLVLSAYPKTAVRENEVLRYRKRLAARVFGHCISLEILSCI